MWELLTDQGLQECAKDYPENLIFFSDDKLHGALRRCSHKKRAAIIAELLVRYSLSGLKPKYIDWAREYLTGNEINEFKDFVHASQLGALCDSAQPLWQATPGSFSYQCLLATSHRFQLLQKTDGLIPFYLEDTSQLNDKPSSFLLPFYFEKDHEKDQENSGVFDLQGRRLDEWSACLKTLNIHTHVTLHCHWVGTAEAFSGHSLMLPLQIAWWRKDSQSIPFYSPFNLVATGEIDNQGHLKPVQIGTKPQAVSERLPNAYFLYPETGEKIKFPEHLKHHPLSCADNQNLFKKVQGFLERITKWEWTYAKKRLKSLSAEVQYGTNRLDDMLKRLKNLAPSQALGRINPVEYFRVLMLQIQVFSYCGDTTREQELIEQAHLFAKTDDKKHPGKTRFDYWLNRLELKRMVLLLDEEQFGTLQTTAQKVATNLNDLKKRVGEEDRDYLDLWMRYCDTMGQAHAYGTLAHVAGMSETCSREFFEQALEAAISKDDPESLLQEYTYIYLHDALFSPGSKDENDFFELVQGQLTSAHNNGNQAALRNTHYLLRYRALAMYRQLLSGKSPSVSPPGLASFRRICGENGAENWVRATIGKYIGAVLASQGQNAKCWFDNAIAALNVYQADAHLIQFIKMTIYAEAFRSLQDNSYLKKAKNMLGKFKKGQGHDVSLPLWKAYIEDPSKPFPGLDYWY